MNTSDEVNHRICEATKARVESFRQSSREDFDRRLAELDREWDTERTLETHAAAIALTGCVLAAAVDRRWIVVPMAVSVFLLQHAVQGWCPPLPLVRRIGVRTMREIEDERQALKALRGDYGRVGRRDSNASTDEILRAVEK